MAGSEHKDKTLLRIRVTAHGDPSVGIWGQDAVIDSDHPLLDYGIFDPEDVDGYRVDVIEAVQDLFGILWGELVSVELVEEE